MAHTLSFFAYKGYLHISLFSSVFFSSISSCAVLFVLAPSPGEGQDAEDDEIGALLRELRDKVDKLHVCICIIQHGTYRHTYLAFRGARVVR